MHPHKSYLICATARSGSYLLCEALTNTGQAGRPGEFFSAGPEKLFLDYWHLTVEEYQQYLTNVMDLGTTPNGVFGAKIIWFTLEAAIAKLRTLPGCAHLEAHELLSTLFPGLHYISITRRDKLRQAISYTKALQTNRWIRKKGQTGADAQELTFHVPTIDRLLQSIEQDEQDMQNFFTRYGIRPFIVVYEDLVEAYEQTAKDILHFLDVSFTDPLTFGERHIVQQADDLTEEWVQRYRALKAGLGVPSEA